MLTFSQIYTCLTKHIKQSYISQVSVDKSLKYLCVSSQTLLVGITVNWALAIWQALKPQNYTNPLTHNPLLEIYSTKKKKPS